MEVKLFFNQRTNSNAYVISIEKDCYIVDPGGFTMEESINYVKDNELNLLGILLTHGHFDHIMGIPEIIKYKKVPVYISEKDYDFLYNPELSLSTWIRVDFKLDKEVEVHTFKEGDKIFSFEIIDTPGHTHGGVCFYNEEKDILISGDTIFKRSYGRTDVPTGSMNDLKKSISKLMQLKGETIVYPGHGDSTTIKDERPTYGY